MVICRIFRIINLCGRKFRNAEHRIFLTVLAAISGLYIFAGNQEVDSLPIMKKMVAGSMPADRKLRFLNKLCAEYWTISPDTALIYGWKGLPLLKEKVSEKNRGNLYFVLGMAWENKGNPDSTLWYLFRAKGILKGVSDQRYYYRVVEQIGSMYRLMGRYDTAIVMMEEALAYFRGVKNDYQVMSTLFNIGSVYFDQNRYNKAIEYYKASAAYDSVLKDTSAMGVHFLGIGNIYTSLGNLFKPYNRDRSQDYFAQGRSYFRHSRNFFTRSSHQTGLCFTSMGLLSSYIDAGMLRQADSLLAADLACLSYPDPRVTTSFMISKAELSLVKGNKHQAIELFRKVSMTDGEFILQPEFYSAMLTFARLVQDEGHHDSAWRIAERSLNWARARDVYPLAAKALSLMAGWAEEDGKLINALALTREAGSYKDSVFQEIGKEIFDETELKFKNQLLLAQVLKLEDEQKIHKFRTLILELVIAVSFLVLALVITWLLSRSRRVKHLHLEAEQKMHLAEHERQISEKSIENLHLAMQLKEQELIYHTLQNADLTLLNRSIREKLSDFQLRFQKKRDQEEFNNILGEIQRDANQDPLNDFEVLFRQMHGDFYEKLMKACPDMSKAELQICALLRLNLSSKDIARLVNLTVSSVDVTRSHIRKKLALEQNQSLSGYLMKL
jgi:tetratricopeptide (TPR) repeat protein/DNA-binding CsgD family transcriptional regulator